jgi:hypothetical protein
MAWPGTTSALDPSSRRAGSCFNLGAAAREVSTIRVRNRTDKYFDLVHFFRCYGQLEKTRPRTIASPPSAFPKCQKRMRTTAVSDGPEGFERRRFDCLKCTVTEIRMLASDPIKSGAMRWLSGE